MVNFNIFSILLCLSIVYHPFTNAAKDIYTTPNVKTVIFTELDVRRTCWSHEEMTLLRTRMIMQDLIPKKVPRDIHYLVEYLMITEEAVVTHSPEGNVRRIMITALSDVLGGYLQAVAIPLAKENYHAGNIDYATMSRLYEMFNEMKFRLGTDGGTWSRSIDMNKFSVKVSALNLPTSDSELACRALVVIPDKKCLPGMPNIAIPYLDYDKKPGAVALPLKTRNLYSLKTAASSHIIVRFYILARQCLSEMSLGKTKTFNRHFMEWLITKVVPHLYDEVWYPGFGSVMRIVETVNETALINQHRQFKFNDTSLEMSLLDSSASGFLAKLMDMINNNALWFLAFLFCLLLAVLIPVFCCYCFIVWSLKGTPFGGKSSSGMLHALLSVYCGLKEGEDCKEESKIQIAGLTGGNVKSTNYPMTPGEPSSIYHEKKTSSEQSLMTDEDSDSSF